MQGLSLSLTHTLLSMRASAGVPAGCPTSAERIRLAWRRSVFLPDFMSSAQMAIFCSGVSEMSAGRGAFGDAGFEGAAAAAAADDAAAALAAGCVGSPSTTSAVVVGAGGGATGGG